MELHSLPPYPLIAGYYSFTNPKDGWSARRAIIDKLPVYTVKQLIDLYDKDKTSLGVVRPIRVLDLTIEEADREWKPEWQALFQQLKLFGEPQKPLRKIPYKFSYVFECEDNKKTHHAMIEDKEADSLPLGEQAELAALSSLSDDTLWTIAAERMPAAQQERLSLLLVLNKRGVLSDAEEAELDNLLERGDKMTLRKAEAALILIRRGHRVDMKQLQASRG